MKILLLISTLFISTHLLAQRDYEPNNREKNAPLVYGQLGSGGGTALSGKIGINMILSNNSIFSLYYGASTHRASTTPSDYTKGILDGDPQQTLGSVIFCFGKIFNTNSPYVRYVLRGGLSGGTVATPTNFQPNSGWFSSNYTYSYKNELTMGLVLNPAIEFPLTRHFGLAAGGYANINPVMPVFGVDVTLIFGGVRHHLDNRARRKY